jgi:anti-sigma regulatory factor (Ser/Thr protein kinase)
MDIRKRIEKRLRAKGEVRSSDVVKETGLSRTYVHRVLQQLVREQKLYRVGKANRARYVRADARSVDRAVASERGFHRVLTNRGLEEHLLLDQVRSETGILWKVPGSIEKIVEYAFTEMVNNAIEHSKSRQITVRMERTDDGIWFMVLDRGIGIYRNVMRTRKLHTELDAIQELIKGKQTTMPERHSGEGIFFTSKVADTLAIKSSTKNVVFDNRVDDTFVRDAQRLKGTQVDFWIAMDSRRRLESVLHEYTGAGFAFDKTRVAVKLFQTDTGLVSRSQARRILAGLEKFKTLVLDFKNVKLVGQGFADEVFRVWRSRHPDKTIEVKNAGKNVVFMIERAKG